ncbi:SusC/RagA family TonB-linked outer membrane protein [Marinifilum sp.]|uniref:SusC/RagA family TonB-linked outer membrane protein n=1 Tax=Marinifilum sp. TaxID=2033137 RepID=UPI003BACB746
MKLVLFLTLALSISASAGVYSQNQKVSFAFKDATILEVLNEIKSQTGLSFIYNEDKIQELDHVNVDAFDKTVEEVLYEILDNSNLESRFDENVIMLVEKSPDLIIEMEQQEIKTIKGKVTDANGRPLPGVSIVIKGSTIGVATDIDGNYSLEFENDNVVLVYSFVGMLPQEIKYTGQVMQNVSLLADTETMDEVVVTGYQAISAERATGSFQNVKVEKVLEQRTTTNVVNVLEGEVNGLLFDQTADGSTPTISLRGISSFDVGNNANMPLLVIDGFPVNNGVSSVETSVNEDDIYNIMANMNPNDIESISVLKDAAAASIWGAQAANGVIVITTKKGKKSDKPNFNFSSAFSIREKPNYSDAYMATGSDMLELDKWALDNGLLNPASRTDDTGRDLYSKGKDLYYNYANGLITEGVFNSLETGLKQNDFVKEYSDLFLRNYTQQQYTFSVSQGSDKFQYYASLNYTDEKSFNKGAGSQSYQTLVNLSAEIIKGVKLSTKINYSVRDIENNAAAPLANFTPYERILDNNGDYVDMYSGGPRASVREEVLAMMGDVPYDWEYNIKRDFDNSDNSSQVRNSDIQVKLDVDILKGLKAELSYNHRHGMREISNYRNEEMYANRDRYFQNAKFDNAENFTGKTVYPAGGTLDGSYHSTTSSDYRGLLNYSGYLDNGKEHFVTAIAGIDYKEDKMNHRTLETLWGYDPYSLSSTPLDRYQDQYYNWFNSSRTLSGGTGMASTDKDKNRYLSNYFNLGYTFKGRYNLTGSWRLDDSNLFGSSSQYRNVPLWSTGVKWRMAEESFINLPFLNRLDVRVSYGTGGRIDRGSSPFLTFYKQTSPDVYTNLTYSRTKDRRNPELRWETTSTVNAGFDFAMLNNRLSGSFEYYSKYTKDVMGRNQINHTFGAESMLMNYGEISNKGFDISLNYKAIQGKDLSWNIGFLMNHNVNKVEEFSGYEILSDYLSASNYSIVEGYAIDELYTYRWAGLSPVDGSPQIYVLDRNPDDADVDEDDQYDIVGVNDDVEITKDDLKYMGHTTPKFFGSLSNSASYKGFTLDVLLTYKFGYKFRASSIRPDEEFANLTSLPRHEDIAKRWRKPGDEQFTNVPALTTGYNLKVSNFYSLSDVLYDDASHIRIQSIGLSYQLDKKILNNTFIKGVTVGANARNLGLLWKATDKDIDPEINNFQGTYRNRATYSFNLKLNF